MKKHKMSVSNGNKKSVLSTHNLKTGHTFDWDHVEVVDTEPKEGLMKSDGGNPYKSQEYDHKPRPMI